jgi:hypothetical protein
MNSPFSITGMAAAINPSFTISRMHQKTFNELKPIRR